MRIDRLALNAPPTIEAVYDFHPFRLCRGDTRLAERVLALHEFGRPLLDPGLPAHLVEVAENIGVRNDLVSLFTVL